MSCGGITKIYLFLENRRIVQYVFLVEAPLYFYAFLPSLRFELQKLACFQHAARRSEAKLGGEH